MADLGGATSGMLALFVITALGYVAARLGYLTRENSGQITKLLLNITLPCTILSSVGQMDAQAGGTQIAWAFGLAALTYPIMLVAGAVCTFIVHPAKGERHLYLFMSVLTNASFIGIAVVSAIYGGEAAFIGSIFVAVLNVFFCSVSFVILGWGGKSHRISWRSMVNPPFVASVAAVVMFFTGFKLPGFLSQAIELAGNVTSPLAMMLVGLVIAGANLRKTLSDWRIYAFTGLRFLVIPALVYLAARAVVPERLVLGVFIMILAMPVGSLAPALAMAYDQDPSIPAKGTIVSTLAAFVIVPALVALMDAV